MDFTIRDVGLRFPRQRIRRARTEFVVIHHLDAHWDVHRTHDFHSSLNWNGIGYNLHVAMDGTISLGRGIEFEGTHKLGHNTRAIGIGCEGRYHSVDRVMPDAQFNALVWLIRYLRDIYGDVRVIGHNEYAATSCPGQFFPLAEVKRLEFRQSTQQPPQIQESEDNDMTQEKFNQMMEKYLAEQRQRAVSEWAKNYWAQATQRGLLDGTAPQGNLTREQAAAIFCRALGVGADVSEWAKDAWEHAKELGVTDGTNPGALATREQVIVMLDRWLGLFFN